MLLKIASLIICALLSPQNFLHHFPVHVGQAIVSALIAEGQALVVDAEEVLEGGV